MIKRMFIMLAIAALVIGGIGFFKYKQILGFIEEGENFVMPPESITTYTVTEQEWQPALEAIGSAVSVNGVEVTADLPGVVKAIHFKSGQAVKKGDLLVELDTTQEESELASAQARLELAKVSLDRAEELVLKRAAAKADLDEAQAEYDGAKADLGEVQARIDRKTIRAPFEGMLGIRRVNLGQYLNAGDPIAELDSQDPIFVRFFVPQQLFDRVRGTREVEISGAGLKGETMRGQVTAVNSRVDEETRNVLVEATFDNPEGLLRAGMFVNVRAVMPESRKLVAVPASAISYAPYGDSVFVVKEMEGPDGQTFTGVERIFVELGDEQGDLIEVTNKLQPGDVVASSGVFKLKPKSPVKVNNTVQPGADPNPEVPDT